MSAFTAKVDTLINLTGRLGSSGWSENKGRSVVKADRIGDEGGGEERWCVDSDLNHVRREFDPVRGTESANKDIWTATEARRTLVAELVARTLRRAVQPTQ